MVAHSKGITGRLLVVFALFASMVVVSAQAAAAGSGGGTVTLTGGGWGHGVGMSQYGAFGQALEDPSITASEIVTHYFTGTSVESLPDVLPGDHFLQTYAQPIWVGLLQNRTSFSFVAHGGSLELCQAGTGEDCPFSAVPADGETWSFVKSGPDCRFERNGEPQGSAGDCSASIAWDGGVRVELPDWNGRSVTKGELKVRPHDGGFHVSLALEIDDYTTGIAEMPTSWHPTALEAQALASRTFAVAKAIQRETKTRVGTLADPGLSSSWQSICWCHVRSSTDQVYVGWSQEQKENWVTAVANTAGLVITHPDPAFTQDGVIEAFYSSSMAGVTESNVYGFGSNSEYPYLLSVDDHWSSDPSLNPNASWSVTVSAADIIAELNAGFTELSDAELVSGPPGSIVRFTGLVGGDQVSVDVTGRWLRRFGLKSGQVTAVSPNLPGGDEPEGPKVVSVRVDDGPSHDGTGNDSKGNNDGAAQCGETIELYVTLRNDGGTTLTSLSATLSETDPDLQLLYNTSSSFPNIGVGASAENPRDWDLRIAPDTASHNFTFTLTITADQGTWQQQAAIAITCGDDPVPDPEGPKVVSVRVDDGPSHDGTGNDSKGNNDGAAQCGETIELYVTLRNDGGTTLTSLSATLSETDPDLQLLYNTSSSFPNIGVGASAENPRDWDLRIAPDTASHNFTFTLTITADQGTWQQQAAIAITCGDDPVPDPEGPKVVSVRVDDGPSHDGTGNDSKGNNDGAAQCGETIELYVTLRNDGGTTLTSLSATLSETDPDLQLLYNTSSSFPNIGVGASAENPRDWDLRIAPDTASHNFTFTLTITADQGTWQQQAAIAITC